MATSKDRQAALRERRASAGKKELRNVWVTDEQEMQLRIIINDWIKANKMSIQAQLNNQALSMLPKVSAAITNANQVESDQMQGKALREIMNSTPCLDDMSPDELSKFDNDLISSFKYNEWIK